MPSPAPPIPVGVAPPLCRWVSPRPRRTEASDTCRPRLGRSRSRAPTRAMMPRRDATTARPSLPESMRNGTADGSPGRQPERRLPSVRDSEHNSATVPAGHVALVASGTRTLPNPGVNEPAISPRRGQPELQVGCLGHGQTGGARRYWVRRGLGALLRAARSSGKCDSGKRNDSHWAKHDAVDHAEPESRATAGSAGYHLWTTTMRGAARASESQSSPLGAGRGRRPAAGRRGSRPAPADPGRATGGRPPRGSPRPRPRRARRRRCGPGRPRQVRRSTR